MEFEELEEDRQKFMRGELSVDDFISRRQSFWAWRMAENDRLKKQKKE